MYRLCFIYRYWDQNTFRCQCY